MSRLSILLYLVSLLTLSCGYKDAALWRKALTRSSIFASKSDENEAQDFRAPQRMMIIEPSTKMKVVLIGTMHYNPTSIELARNTVRELGEKKTLYSVLVESCPERWEKALASQPPGSLMAAVFESEMQAASLAAKEFSRPLVLGDQRFGDTTSRIKTVFLQSLRDIVSPWKGWKSLYEDIAGLGKDFIPKGNDNFGLSDILDPKLLSTAPISILRYTSAIVLKAPKFGVPALGLFVYSAVQSVAEEMNPSALMPAVESSTDIALSIAATAAFNVLQVALLGRVILQALLHERNVIIAANILEECKRAKLAGKEGDTVVAVLGMAHCNGVKDMLTAAGSQ